MATATSSPVIVSADPNVFNTGEELRISVPVTNIGSSTAQNAFLISITLGGATRISPKFFPVYIATLKPGGTGSVNARFSLAGLIPGKKYLLTLRGAYGPGSSLGFSLSRYITIPTPAVFPIRFLKASVDVGIQDGVWTYTIHNSEAAGSGLFVNTFSLDVATPVSITRSPPGWQPLTDTTGFVGWVAADMVPPYEGQVAPGASLGGFEIQSTTRRSESTPYVLTSWNHGTDQAGVISMDVIPSPARPV